MAAQKGLEFLLKIGDGASPEVFTTVMGGQTKSLTRNNESVDITSQDETDRDRELLAGAGVNSFSASLSGVFKDDAGLNAVEVASRASTYSNFQCIIPNYGTFEGPFHIESLEYSGEHNGEVQYSISLESASSITFTPA